MSVYRHKNSPYWQYDFQRGGHRFSESTGIPISRPKREAQAAEKIAIEAAERLVAEIRGRGRKPVTLGDACDRWWIEVGQYGAERDLQQALAWLKEQIGAKVPLHKISDADVLAAIAARRQHCKASGHDDDGRQLYKFISPRTINRTVPLLLRRIMRRARDLWDVAIIREPKWRDLVLPVPRRHTPEISVAQEAEIDATERDDYHAVRKFATITGLRLREALLTWPQVDFENRVIRVIAKGEIPRIVPLSHDAYAILWAERGRHPEFVFTFVARRTKIDTRTGKEYIRGERYPITPAGITSNRRRHWPVQARWHDLRHTAGRRTVRATGNLKAAQALLGHADIATTSRFYVDALVEDVRAAMEATAADTAAKRAAVPENSPENSIYQTEVVEIKRASSRRSKAF